MPGGGVLEIFAFQPQLPAERIPWNRVGLTHFCFDVRGIHKWHAYLKGKGRRGAVGSPSSRRAATGSSSCATSTAT